MGISLFQTDKAAPVSDANDSSTSSGFSLTSAVDVGWQPNSYKSGMNFGDTGYQASTSFGGAGAAPSGASSPVFAPGGFEEQNSAPQASLGHAGNASIQSAGGISSGSFDMGGSMLGDVSMNKGLSGMLGQEAIGSIASTASKFQNKVAKVPGFEI